MANKSPEQRILVGGLGDYYGGQGKYIIVAKITRLQFFLSDVMLAFLSRRRCWFQKELGYGVAIQFSKTATVHDFRDELHGYDAVKGASN